jgi:hypothetical protein
VASPPRVRPLTDGERELAAEVFGAGIDPAPVRLLATGLSSRIFVAGRWGGRDWMIYPRRRWRPDFADASVPVGETATFVHELTHVWQAQHGVNLALAKLRAGDSAAAYAHPTFEGCDFARLTIEQQAVLVEHAFLLSRGMRRAGGWEAADYGAVLPFESFRSRA